jgi:hypothetical protein
MSDETPDRRGDAAWKYQRDEISRRNADAHKRAEAQRQSRASVAEARLREDAQRESEQLRDLNARIAKQQGR